MAQRLSVTIDDVFVHTICLLSCSIYKFIVLKKHEWKVADEKYYDY